MVIWTLTTLIVIESITIQKQFGPSKVIFPCFPLCYFFQVCFNTKLYHYQSPGHIPQKTTTTLALLLFRPPEDQKLQVQQLNLEGFES